MNKILWVNNAKAIGITLVVFGHVWRGLQGKGLLNEKSFFLIDNIVYSFHMPLFFIISGFFVKKSLQKTDKQTFIKNKIKTLMYPYFIWSIIQILINFILNNYTNNSTDLISILRLIYIPIAPFWYLYSLFLMFLLYTLTQKINIKLNFLIAIGIYYLPDTHILLIENLFSFYIFFLIGTILFSYINDIQKHVFLFFLGLLIFILSFYFYRNVLESIDISKYLLPAIFGSLSVFCLSNCINSKFFNYIGERSLIIFLLHIFFTAGTRIILIHIFNIRDSSIHITFGLVLGMFGPIIFYQLTRKLKIKGLFVYPF
jgi:fucose 4-O-acetylase-like acetyltransferase